MRHLRGVMLLVLVVWLAFPARSNQVGDEDLEKAVATMRNIVPDKMSKEEKEARAKELTKAWQTIQSTGEKGIKRLSAELDSLEKSKQEDDFFQVKHGRPPLGNGWPGAGRVDCSLLALSQVLFS